MSQSGRRGALVLVGILLLGAVSVFAAGAIEGVFFGNPRSFHKPAELESAKVLQVIPEYKELQRENLDRTEPRYWILLDKVQRVFFDAVTDVAKRYGYDLVGEKGYLRGHELPKDVTRVTDITLAVLDELQRKDK